MTLRQPHEDAIVLAVDNRGLGRVQSQADLLHPFLQRGPHLAGTLFGSPRPSAARPKRGSAPGSPAGGCTVT